MKSVKSKRKEPEIILRNGRPAAVTLDIEEDREMLERLDDAEDLKTLAEMRKGPLKFRRLEEFLREFSPRAGVRQPQCPSAPICAAS